MNTRFTISLLLLTAFAAGCDRIPFLGGGSDTAQEDSAAADTTTAAPEQPDTAMTPMEDTGEASEAAPQQEPVQEARPEPPPRPTPQTTPAPVAQGEDVPWTPERTGTVSPGMTSEEVRGEWGEPVVERATGEWTFMYYRNGCERTCGTFDVVFLQGGQVVDAIVRGQGHEYAGVSSSPADRPASFTPPTGNTQPDTLRIRG